MQLSNQLVSILTAALFIHLVLLRTGQASLQFLGQPQFTAYVSRAAPPGSVVYTLTAINSTTHARPDGIRYTLVEGSYDSSLFELHALTGQLVNLQYLPLQSWSLQVQAHTGADSLQAELLVIVEPEYKFLPVFERSIFSFSISEETPVGSLFGVVRAFSLDPEVEGHSYTIITGNAGNDLAISTTTGVLTVARELDYEVTSEYSLIVEYSDGAGHITVSVEVEVLDENDNSPIFPVVLYEATLSESAHVGSTVLTVFASDDDAGENSEMTYSILEGDVNRFEIESLSGELTTAVLFDYEQEVEYTFIVIASDEGDPMLTTSVIVVVSIENEDDECPIFLSTYYTITFPPESVPEVEEVVTTVHAIDPDYIGSITYSIEPSSPAFSIDPITGAVTLHDTTPNKHTLRLLAIDDGACEHETFVTVVINVGSTNRHTPQFMTPCSGQILEGSPTGTIATTLEATDDDAGIYGEVTYAFSEENSVFSIHSSTGDVTLLDEEGLDYEEKKSYFIDVTATDLSNRQAYCLLTITVLDANDHAPQFIGTEDFDYEVRLPEFAPIGSFVVQMLAEDADNGSNAVVEYELLEETGDFSIDDTSGVVTVAIASLSAGVYTLSIQASNPNEMSPLMSSVRSLTVHVSSDSVIAFNQSLYTTTICENLQVSTPALEVFTNETELVFFSIVSGSEYSSNSEDVFEILDDTSGVITASSQANIDYEQLPNSKFVFSVTAEHLTGATHSISTVEITLLDSDDNSPTFQSGHIYTVSENAPIGTTVGHISATDPDSGTNGDIAFSFIQGNDMFTITDSGDLVTNMEIDAEAMALDTIVRINARNPNPVDPDSCTSGPRPSATVVITITTLNLNDNSPFFVDPAISSVSLPEDTPVHSTITTFSASDNDVDSSPSDIQYSITGDDMQQNFILSENGALVLVKPLDYEVRQSFVLNVEVSDGLNTNSTQYTVNVANIDDEAPIFTRDFYTTSITENLELGETVLQVLAEDVDTHNVSYWLTGTAEGRLSIDNTGLITVSGNIDREEFQGGNFSFLVVADGGTLATAEVIIVVNDVNDCVPRFPSIDTMVVMENVSPGEGLEVGSVTAYDLDAGSNGELSYTLESGENNGFRINETTGLITAHMMYNRETAPFFTLLVAATDMGQNVQFSTVTTVQVKIGDENDNAPYFPYAYMYTRIFENSPIGKEVFLLQAVDLDEGENAELTYSLLSPQSDSGQVFELNQTTGAIRLAQSLDYEDPLQRHFSLTFSVADSMNEADTHTTLHIEVLDRNDNIPVIEITATPESLPLPENTAVGSVILELRASDEDSGVNAQLVFAVTDGDPNGDFVIISSGNDAVVSIANELDYERTTSYDLLFTVCDQGTPVGCSTLEHSITIDNIDDVVPAFNQSIYRASVEENQPPSSILQVAATDLDSRESFEYKIISGNDHDRFSINSTSGEISSTVMLDREEQETYTLVISAADEGGTPLSGTGTAIITVTDVNDNSPVGNSEWEVVMLLLDGTLPDNHSVTYFFNDPDTSSTFSNCSIIESVAINSFFDINRDECLLLLNSGNTPVNDYSVRVFEKNARIYSTVNIEVEHITLSDIPIDHLITVSLAVSSRKHLESVYTMFPDILSTLLGIDKNLVTVISIQNGYHNPTETVDVSFLVKTDENTYFSSPFVLQTLYRERDRFRSLSEYNLSALPTDPCSAEPCSSQASCTSIKTVHESSVTAISPSFVLVFPVIELGYECECVPGISGENCSINFNDCYSNPCHFDAQCIDEVNDYRCVCPPGTTGQDCSVSPDGCSSNPCQNGAECRDIPGSHSCLCLPGYHGPECQYQYFRTATTCDSSPCQNGGTCSPGRDSFTCICPDTHSGQLCETDTSPDGCTGNPCYNGSTCNDSDSELVCLCSVGFTGPFCRWPIDECELEPCLNGGTCATGLYGSYQCYCPPPYTGESCEVFVSGCESSPCENGGRCADVRDSSDYTCECVRGFYGDNCEYRVDPGDLCADDINPCIAGNCTYGLNSYTCTCLSDYSGEHCEVESPPATSCDANPCLHGGECILLSDSNDYNCSCTPGFAGTNCELNIDECSPNPCINGVCRDGINGYVCECDTLQVTGYNCDVWCPSGLSGDFCQTEISLCDPTLCQNGGTCAENRENGSYYCMCPPTHRGQACELDNTCDSVTCFNDGTCSALEDGGYGCVCSNGFEGDNCQLITVSFTGSSSQPTYRAYPSLHISPRGRVQLEFTTIDSDGLLLYNTQLQSGVSDDFIAVEVVGGQLVVSVSHGEGWVRLESSVLVSDGRWHQVTIDIAEKRTSVTLDWCHNLDEDTGRRAGCYITADTTGESSFLDLGLPLWLGGAPSLSASHVSSQDITACVRQVLVNGDMLDLNSHIDQSNSQPGCPQLDSQCSSGECGVGECVPSWTRPLCDCPPLLSGALCDTGSPSVSYFGKGYARYTLTDEGLRESRQTGGVLRSTYEDRVSLTLRTAHSDGFLFGMYGEAEDEYLYIELESGQIVLHIRLDRDVDETVLAVPSQDLSDSLAHTVALHRSGAHLNLSLDSNITLHHSLPLASPLTLETLTSEIYTGGSPFIPASSWFTGCLQDVRIGHVTLPTTSAGNNFASVVYEGGEEPGVTEGCSFSPCYFNPCGSAGVCEETSSDSYECICSDGGQRVAGPCPQPEGQAVNLLPYIISAVIVALLVATVCVSLIAGVIVWWRRKQKRTYLVSDAEKTDGHEMADFFAPNQAVVISNEQGGGEVDASEIDWAPITVKCGSSDGKSSPQSSKSASSKESPSVSSSTSPASSSRGSGEKSKRQRYRFHLPVPVKEEPDGAGEEDDIRSNSPVIRAYLEERVDTANDEIHSVDSLRRFAEEGSEDSEVDSFSSAYHSEEEGEGYTLERLQAAGPPLSSLAPLLQHVLQSTAEISTQVSPSSTSDVPFTPYIPQ